MDYGLRVHIMDYGLSIVHIMDYAEDQISKYNICPCRSILRYVVSAETLFLLNKIIVPCQKKIWKTKINVHIVHNMDYQSP